MEINGTAGPLANGEAHGDREELTQNNQVNSSLLRLPTEIRDIIYTYVFYGHTMRYAAIACPWLHAPYGVTGVRLNPLALRQTCRQVRHETRPIFFKFIKFGFDTYDALQNVVQKMEVDMWGEIQRIQFPLDTAKHMTEYVEGADGGPLVWYEHLKITGLSNLEHVHVQASSCRRVQAALRREYGDIDVDRLQKMACFLFEKKSLDIHLPW